MEVTTMRNKKNRTIFGGMENKLELLINYSFPHCSQKEIVGGVIMNILQHIHSCPQNTSMMCMHGVKLISLYWIHHSLIEHSVALAQQDTGSTLALTETRQPQCELCMTQAKQSGCWKDLSHFSTSRTPNTGTLQGWALGPLQYSLYTSDCTAIHSSHTTVKFADNRKVDPKQLVTGDRDDIGSRAKWCFSHSP